MYFVSYEEDPEKKEDPDRKEYRQPAALKLNVSPHKVVAALAVATFVCLGAASAQINPDEPGSGFGRFVGGGGACAGGGTDW